MHYVGFALILLLTNTAGIEGNDPSYINTGVIIESIVHQL